jgi:WD40 repeat protein
MRITANLETKMTGLTNSLGPVLLLLMSAGAAAPVEPADKPTLPPEPFAVVGDGKKAHFVQFGHDSKSLAVMDSNGAVRLYDLAARQFGPVVVKNEGLRPFVLSPCGRFLLMATERLDPKFAGQRGPDGFQPRTDYLVLWDLKTGQSLGATPNGRQAPVGVPYFSPPVFSQDGSRFYYIAPDNAVGVWDTTKRAAAGTFKGPPKPISGLALSADGKRLAVGSTGRIDVWDTATGERVHMFTTKGVVHQPVFLPDGKTLLAIGVIKSTPIGMGLSDVLLGILRFDVAAGKELDPFPPPHRLLNRGATGFRLSPDGRIGFLVGTNGGLFLIDPQTGKGVGPGWIRLWFPDLVISPDGKYIAGTGSDGAVVYTTESLLKAK